MYLHFVIEEFFKSVYFRCCMHEFHALYCMSMHADVVCKGFVPKCTILEKWEKPMTIWLLMWVTVWIGAKISVWGDWQLCSSFCLTNCLLLCANFCICHQLVWKICVFQHEFFGVQNFFELKRDSMKVSRSCEQTVAGFWTKSEEVLESLGSSSSSFSTKVTSKRMRRIWSTFEMFQTFEKLLYQKILRKKFSTFVEWKWKWLKDSFTCFKEKLFVFCKEILAKFLFHKKDFCTI